LTGYHFAAAVAVALFNIYFDTLFDLAKQCYVLYQLLALLTHATQFLNLVYQTLPHILFVTFFSFFFIREILLQAIAHILIQRLAHLEIFRCLKLHGCERSILVCFD
jgi:hypothetical protein